MKFVTDASELAEWEQLDDAELLRRVRDGIKSFRAKDRAKDTDPSNVASSKEIERRDHHSSANAALDDPNPTGANSPRAPERNGSELERQLRRRPDVDVNATDSSPVARAERSIARDVALDELAIRERGGANMDGELLAARARRISHVDVAAAERVVPGYGRLK